MTPQITYVLDDSGNPAFPATLIDAITNDTDFALGGAAGSADPNEDVAVYFGGNVIGQTTSNADGSWELAGVGALIAALPGNDTMPSDGLLDDGMYDFTVTSNGTDFSAAFTVTIDTVGPTAVAITSVSDSAGPITDGNTNENDVLIEGTTDESTNLVAIYDGDPGTPVGTGPGVLLGTASVAANGTWQFQTNETNDLLTDTTHTFYAVATDGAGNAGPTAMAGSILVDTMTPDAPVILDFTTDSSGAQPGEDATDGITDDTIPIFNGTGEELATVEIWLTDTTTNVSFLYGRDVVGAYVDETTPNWDVSFDENLTPAEIALLPDPAKLLDGTYTISATQTDPSGNESDATTVIVQTDEDGDILGLLEGDADDLHEITIDNTDPDAPVIETYSDSGAVDDPLTGPIVTNVDDGVFTGTAEPNSTLTGGTIIYTPVGSIPQPSQNFSGEVVVDASGNFTVDLAALGVTPAADGHYAITVHTTDAAGNQSAESDVFEVVVDTIHEVGVADGTADAPTIDTGEDDVDADAGAGGDTGGQAQDGTPLALAHLDVTNDDTPELNGTAEAGADVNIFEVVNGQNIFVGTTTALPAGDPNAGDWMFTLPAQTDGAHTYVANAIDIAGNFSSVSGNFDLTIDTAVDAPTITLLDGDSGIVGDGIINATYGDLHITGEPGALVNHFEITNPDTTVTIIEIDNTTPNLIVDGVPTPLPVGGIAFLTIPPAVFPATEGELVVPVSGPLLTLLGLTPDDGDYSIIVKATDEAGNVSDPSGPFNLTLDTIHDTDANGAADIPVVTAITVNGIDFAPIPPINSTSDTDLNIKGTAEAGSTVEVTLTDITGNPALNDAAGNPLVFTVTADANGEWALTPGLDGTGTLLTDNYVIDVEATDVAGNSANALPVSFDINAAMATPVITGFVDDVPAVESTIMAPNADGDSTDDTQPELVGIAEAGATVQIYMFDQNGVLVNTPIGDVVADGMGDWAFTIPTALAEGTHTFQANASDGIDTSAFSQTFDIVVDLTAEKPTINDSVDEDTGFDPSDKLTNDNMPTVSGTAEPNATVDVFLIQGASHVPVGTVTADANGDWSITVGLDGVDVVSDANITSPLPNGEYTFDASQTDVAGNTSGFVDTANLLTITIDATALDVPVIASISDDTGVAADASTLSDTITSDTELTIDGTVPGFPVTAGVDNPVAGANATVNIYATNAAGDSVDATGAVILAPAPILTGVAVDMATGAFSAALGALPEGEYLFTATSVDAAGNESNLYPMQNVPMTIDLTPPAIIDTVDPDTITPMAPTGDPLTLAPIQLQVGEDTEDVDAAPGSASSLTDNITNDTLPNLQGTVDPGSFVEVFGAPAGGAPASLGMAVVDINGNWTFDMPDLLADNPLLVPDAPFSPTGILPDGDFEFSLVATDAAGNASAMSAPVTVTVDTFHDGNNNGLDELAPGTFNPDTLANDPDPDAPTSALVTDTGNPVLDALDLANPVMPNVIVTTTVDGITNQTSGLMLTGTAEAGSTITITNGGGMGDVFTFTTAADVLGNPLLVQDNQTLADANGNWSIAIPDPTMISAFSADGLTFDDDVTMDFNIQAVDIAGNPDMTTQNVTIDIDAPIASINALGPQQDTGVLGDGITSVNNLTLSGFVDSTALTGNDDTSRESVEIFNNGISIGTALVRPNDNWVFITGTLADDDYSFTVQATDAAGNVGPVSAPLDITIDVTAITPEITGITDDTGVADDGITSDDSPEIAGTAGAGDTVEVFQDGVSLGSVTADANGDWAFPVAGPLADDTYSFTASTFDAATNSSLVSPAFDVEVDTTTDIPVITDILDDDGNPVGTTADDDLDLEGTAEAGASVQLLVNGQPAGNPVVADASGNWAVATGTLPAGNYTLTVEATDVAGNTETSNPSLITIEARDPADTDFSAFGFAIHADLNTGEVTTDNLPTVGDPGANPVVTLDPTDEITATAFADMLIGNANVNFLYGGDGDDIQFGDAGNDKMFGEAGDDELFGDAGADTMRGGAGNDIIEGGTGSDRILGGDGDDEINGQVGNDVIDGDAGNDTIFGEAGADTIRAGDGDDTVEGGVGNDNIEGGAGEDNIIGHSGEDTIDGGADNDKLWGGNDNDIMDGGDGDDSVNGGTGDDEVNGGAGDDRLWGLDGDDTINGGAGDDIMQGNGGDDTFVFEAGFGADVIQGFVQGEDAMDVSALGITALGDLTLADSALGANHAEITIGGDSVVLIGIKDEDLTATDFIFA